MSDEIEFSDEQQEYINKLVGNARVKAREKAEADYQADLAKREEEAEQARLSAEGKWKELAEKAEARARELEPLQTRLEKYEKLVAGLLRDKVKALGESAKSAVDGLPESMSTEEKLDWLTRNEGLFKSSGDGVGTPRTAKPASGNGSSSGLSTRVPIKL